MRIVHIEDTFYPEFGYQLNFLAKWNAIHGNEVYILTSDSLRPWIASGFLKPMRIETLRGKDEEYCQRTGVRYIERFRSYFSYSGREFVTGKIFKRTLELKPDIVMLHGLEMLTTIRGMKFFKKHGIPVVVDSHAGRSSTRNKLAPIFHRWFSKNISPFLEKNSIPVVAVSEATKKFLVEDLKVPEHLIEVIPLGTDTSLFKPVSEEMKIEIRKNLGLDEGDFVFIYTGKISPDKKVHLLVEAFKILKKRCEGNVRLVIVGEGKGEYYENVVKDSKIVGDILIFPRQNVNDLPKFYAAADVGVWPGGCSLSVYDAQASGLPVLLENSDINIERTSYGNGLTFEMDSVESLEKSMEKFLNMDSSEFKEMRKRAIEHVVENHSYDVIASRFENIFEKVSKGVGI